MSVWVNIGRTFPQLIDSKPMIPHPNFQGWSGNVLQPSPLQQNLLPSATYPGNSPQLCPTGQAFNVFGTSGSIANLVSQPPPGVPAAVQNRHHLASNLNSGLPNGQVFDPFLSMNPFMVQPPTLNRLPGLHMQTSPSAASNSSTLSASSASPNTSLFQNYNSFVSGASNARIGGNFALGGHNNVYRNQQISSEGNRSQGADRPHVQPWNSFASSWNGNTHKSSSFRPGPSPRPERTAFQQPNDFRNSCSPSGYRGRGRGNSYQNNQSEFSKRRYVRGNSYQDNRSSGYRDNQANGYQDNAEASKNSFESSPKLGRWSPAKFNTPSAPVNYGSNRTPFNRRQQSNRGRNRRQDRQEGTEKPFACDACDRAFTTDELLREHLAQHVKCDYEGCTVEAHPKIVQKHKQLHHDTGLAERIGKLQDPEEIKKWREDRKKNFPTAENIAKRAAEKIEKEARGEVVENKEFGKMKRKNEENGDVRPRKRPRFENRRNRYRDFQHKVLRNNNYNTVKVESDEEDCPHIKLVPFPGIKALDSRLNAEVKETLETLLPQITVEEVSPETEQDSEGNVDGEELQTEENSLVIDPHVDKDESEVLKEATVIMHENNSNLFDSDDEPPTVVRIRKDPIDDDQNSDQRRSFDSSETGNASREIANLPAPEKKDLNARNHADQRRGRGRRHGDYQNKYQRPLPPTRPSLLQSLMDPQIRHEHNVLMQCIRHIVNNNFFQK